MQFLNIDKFSNYKRFLNVTNALVLRVINNLKKSLNREENVVERYVTTEEYNKEHLWLVFIQHDVTKVPNYKHKKI